MSGNLLNIEMIRNILAEDNRVIFAYLYGSFTEEEHYKDVDIAVYSTAGCDVFRLSTDLKIALHEHTGLPPDFFDIRVINRLIDYGDLFSLLYLKHIFEINRLLVDEDFAIRTDFLEKYSMKYRECEGLLDEVLV